MKLERQYRLSACEVNCLKIAILGSGAMGSLFGAYLSQKNDVWLIDIDPQKVERINTKGITVVEKEVRKLFKPKAVVSSKGLGEMDLIIVFVKSMYTIAALEQNKHLIGEKTYLITLQNGAGHESKLLKFADKKNVLIGTTQHNSSVSTEGEILHGGGGKTIIGVIDGNISGIRNIALNFTSCGIQTEVSDDVKKQIWTKLFLNTAASSLTAILQVPLGFISENPHACSLMESLARESVKAANTECSNCFIEDEIIKDIKDVLNIAKEGYTSIYSDIKNGNYTEVDTISGYVLEVAKKNGIPAPYHQFVVSMIHALEDKAHEK